MVKSASLSDSQRELWPVGESANDTDTYDVRGPQRPPVPAVWGTAGETACCD